MKRCPQCHRPETDDALTFCRIDGTPLVRESGAASDNAETLRFSPSQGAGATETSAPPTDEALSKPTAPTTVLDTQRTSGRTRESSQPKSHKKVIIAAAAIIAIALAACAYLYFARSKSVSAKNSIAVLPFQNASGDPNMEYLSDGITESLINSLSQLPNLAVKARSTVFRYKGREVDPQKVGAELNVQAILSGRVAQRGDELALSLELVDAKTGDQVWGTQYTRKLSDLVTLQGEIARDVSDKLRVKLSSADAQKLAKNYTENNEAYQLYLKGRYHSLKLTQPEMQKGISYFEQATAADPSYALAYAGLADVYRSLSLSGEMRPSEVYPQARRAANKAIEIDDTLAEAHAALGNVIFRYDWDWKAAEQEFKRALELDPNSADAHANYAHVLSTLGRHPEALAEIKRARELDPLNLRTNCQEGQFLLQAGHTDEALARLQKTFELDPNFWLAHTFASAAYSEKGMYAEAIAEARKARELTDVTHPASLLGYALAKSGRQAEARAVLDELLKSSKERYIPAYNIALVYNGLDERDKTFEWLGRGVEERDARMVWLKVEPKWNHLRADPRFADLMRRVGLPQ